MRLEQIRRVWKQMNPRARLAAVLVACIAAVAVYGSFAGGGTDQLTDETGLTMPGAEMPESLVPVDTPAVAQTEPVESMGRPTDPLPEPLSLPADVGNAASMLARVITAGGAEALPALVTALRMAGFAVYGTGDAIVVTPEGPDQGLYFEAWQVRSMAALAGRRHIGVPLTTLGSAIAVAAPALREQPVAKLLIDDIVDGATSEDASTRFWAQLILELGKQARAEDELNTIQVALITYRLSAEIATVAAGRGDSAGVRPRFFSLPIVYADEPCTPSQPRPKPKVTQTAFKRALQVVTAPSRWAHEQAGKAIKNLLDYPNVMLMLSALRLDVEMEGGPPLKRTKTTSAGEQRKVRAKVSLDSSALEWLNCFRAELMRRNRDTKWLPREPGPLPDVPVDFALDGQAIVRIPTSAPANERGLPDATKTDAGGIARLAIEGEPQLRKLPDTAREDRKRAATTVTARVRPVQLLTGEVTSDDPSSTNAPYHHWILFQEFPLEVSYPFEVMDWLEGPGRWSGTIELVETTITGSTEKGTRDEFKIQETTTSRATVQIGDTVSEQSGGGVYANLAGTIRGNYSSVKTASGWQTGVCRHERKMSSSSRSSSAGEADGDATISVTVFEDGTYLAAANSDLTIQLEGESTSENEVFGPPPDCSVGSKSSSVKHAPLTRPVVRMIQVNGKIDPKEPNELSGTLTEEDAPPPVEGRTLRRTRTTTWKLRRH